MDETTFANSISAQETEFEFSSRQYSWLPDSNNGSYSNGQVIFDMASLANSGKFMDWSQSFLTIPLVLNVNLGTNTVATAENVFAASLKNGFHQLINSLSLEVTNNSVVNLTNLSNLAINYKLLTSCSKEDEQNFLPSLNFVKDNAESIYYQPNADKTGFGECNNTIASQLFVPTSGWGQTAFKQNAGRLGRMVSTSFDPNLTAAASNYTLADSIKAQAKNYATQDAANINFFILATIPLKIVHDIFKKLPLTKGMYARLILNTNCNCSVVCNTNAAGTSFVDCAPSTLNGVLPFQLSPVAAGNGFAVSTGGATRVTATMGIAKVGSFSHTLTQCRIYAPLYEMSPIYEEKYFQMVPTKRILYNDILQFTTLNVGRNGGNVNQILTNGISRPRFLIGVPILSSIINGGSNLTAAFSTGTNVAAGQQAFSPMNSPFSSSPGTCCPYFTCTNFNVLVSGVALYPSAIQYKYEHWLEEIRGSNSINGGIDLAMSSGLLSQTDWEHAYGFIYCDLSRRTGQASDDVSRSIQVQLTSSSNAPVDIYWILGFEREITISTSTGALVI